MEKKLPQEPSFVNPFMKSFGAELLRATSKMKIEKSFLLFLDTHSSSVSSTLSPPPPEIKNENELLLESEDDAIEASMDSPNPN